MPYNNLLMYRLLQINLFSIPLIPESIFILQLLQLRILLNSIIVPIISF